MAPRSSPTSRMPGRKAFFLDRDGVINAAIWNDEEGKLDTPYRLQDFRLLPGVPEAIRKIEARGFLRVVISNQPGVAKEKCTPQYLEDTKTDMAERLAEGGANLAGIYYCIHHPEASFAPLLPDCDCRKPKPGLLLDAARDLDIDLGASWMVG